MLNILYTRAGQNSRLALLERMRDCTADQYIILAESIASDFVYDQANIVGLKTAEYLNEVQRFALDKAIKLTMTQQSKVMITAKAMINKAVMQVMGLLGG